MTPLLLLASAVFVGNDACRPCHAEIVRRYEAMPMARSTGRLRANNVPAGAFSHRASGTEYVISRDGAVSFRRGSARTREQLDFVVGSGSAGHSYLIFRDRWLFQAPITWYSQSKRWDAAPGYENDPFMAWDRPVDPSCLSCHASQLTHIYGSLNRYAETPFRQAGVSCERCHGPGSDHIRNGEPMIAPVRLDPERRDDVCRQCHLMGEARIARQGRAFGEFRAGQRLGEYVAYFVYDDANDPALRTTSHFEKLQASRCKQASGDRMWCGSCHQIHTRPSDPVSWFRQKCLACHDAQSTCTRGPNCISCHMPKLRAVDAGHGAFTDHAISRRPRTSGVQTSQPWRLRPFSRADAGDRELILAYRQLYERSRDERQRREATRLMERQPSSR